MPPERAPAQRLSINMLKVPGFAHEVGDFLYFFWGENFAVGAAFFWKNMPKNQESVCDTSDLFFPKRKNTAGVTTISSSVELSNPPKMTVATG